MLDSLATLALLLALELVLGVDNIVVITIIVSKLPPAARRKARIIGLALALVARLVMVAGFSWVLSLTGEVLLGMSVKDLILLAGGGFLIWKAVREIHHTVEMIEHHEAQPATPRNAFASAIAMIVALDVVFAIDSVVTAVGLTNNLTVIALAVILSFVVLLIAAGPIGEFVLRNPTFKILALSLLITIGIVLVMEAFHYEVPKPYIYLPMAFATGVQLLQWRLMKNQQRRSEVAPPATPDTL
ncbi:TerC family protein [Botrimarina sp.]|uniref:TerC family protein n=1 Tax=Botrimarina sp. TaxID=2795802 RepID=UPI0032EBF126